MIVRLGDGDQVSQGETIEDAIEIDINDDHKGKEVRKAVLSESTRVCMRVRIEKRKNA